MKRAVGGRRSVRTQKRRSKRTTSSPPLQSTAGGRAAAQWLRERHLGSSKPWYAEVALDVVDRPASVTYFGDTDTRFHINVYPEEWGVFFCTSSRASWIRVTDEPFVHGRDDHDLLSQLPELSRIGYLLHALEERYRIRFRRDHALVRTNLIGGQKAIRAWLAAL